MSQTKETNIKNFKKTKIIYIIMMSLYGFADKLYGSIYIAFMRSANLSMLQISNLFSIEQILLAIFDYPTGTISDKIGRKRIASHGFITWGISLLIFAYSKNYTYFLISMLLMSLGLALISGAPGAWLVDHMIKDGVYEERTKIFPQIQTIVSFFAIIASIFSYFFIDISKNLPIIAAGLISIFTGLYSYVVGEDNYGFSKHPSLLKTLNENLKSFLKDKRMIFLTIKKLLSYVSFVAFILYWQIYLTETLELEAKFLPMFLIIFMFSLTAGNYLSSRIANIISNYYVSIVGLMVSAVGFALLILGDNLITFIIGSILIEVGFGIEQAMTPTWTMEYIKSEVRASYASIFSTIQSIFGFFIINLLGIFSELAGINIIWLLGIVVIFLEIGIVLLFVKKYKSIRSQ